MTRTQHLTLADAAAGKATQLARDCESVARRTDTEHRAGPLAAAGSLWADIAAAHAAIAAALPDTDNRSDSNA